MGGGGYSVLVNYQSFLSNLFSLAPPTKLFFFISSGRNRLLHVSFIEQYDFIICQYLNTRIKILPLATSQIPHLCNQFNQSFLSNLFSLAPPTKLFFFISSGRNRLLHVSFIEQYDFIICQYLNTRIKILPLATSQIPHLCNQFNHVCSANFNTTF